MNDITKEQIQELALEVALRFHLSDFDEDKKASDIYDAVGKDQDIVIWETFENWDANSITDSIWNLSNDIETTISDALGLTES
jgi:hypothetical protein